MQKLWLLPDGHPEVCVHQKFHTYLEKIIKQFHFIALPLGLHFGDLVMLLLQLSSELGKDS